MYVRKPLGASSEVVFRTLEVFYIMKKTLLCALIYVAFAGIASADGEEKRVSIEPTPTPTAVEVTPTPKFSLGLTSTLANDNVFSSRIIGSEGYLAKHLVHLGVPRGFWFEWFGSHNFDGKINSFAEETDYTVGWSGTADYLTLNASVGYFNLYGPSNLVDLGGSLTMNLPWFALTAYGDHLIAKGEKGIPGGNTWRFEVSRTLKISGTSLTGGFKVKGLDLAGFVGGNDGPFGFSRQSKSHVRVSAGLPLEWHGFSITPSIYRQWALGTVANPIAVNHTWWQVSVGRTFNF